jgi:Kae1-associated kinase Bud32
MEKTILARGAEAVITKSKGTIIKDRIEKTYRHQDLDKKIRKLRTRSETKILEKLSKKINVPKIISSDENKAEIKMEYINGKKLAEILEKTEYKKVAEKIGKTLAKMHNEDIIHGDLTTSNILLKEKDIYFIDFGLSFHSYRIEDKAVDIHLIKQALEAKHPAIYEITYQELIKSYKKHSKDAQKTISQLEKVEKRGRYKAQY